MRAPPAAAHRAHPASSQVTAPLRAPLGALPSGQAVLASRPRLNPAPCPPLHHALSLQIPNVLAQTAQDLSNGLYPGGYYSEVDDIGG